MTTKSRSGHVGRLLVASACLTLLVIVCMIDGYPLRELGPWLQRYVPDNVDSSETIATSFPAPFRHWMWWNHCAEEEVDTTATTDEHNSYKITSSPPEFQMNLKKKNSEIISVLMGLRRAMSNNYGNGVGERRLRAGYDNAF